MISGVAAVIVQHQPTLIVERHDPNRGVDVAPCLQTLGHEFERLSPGLPIEDRTQGRPEPARVWGPPLTSLLPAEVTD